MMTEKETDMLPLINVYVLCPLQYTLPENEVVTLSAGDRIGFTFEQTTGAFSFQYVEGHRTYFRKVDNDEFPVVGQAYVFDNIHLPSIFSVAVEVTTGGYKALD